MTTRRKRKPVIRRFLKRNYQVLSVLLISAALTVVLGIGGHIIDMDGSFLPIHVPMIIGAAISAFLGYGLIWIYGE